MKFNLLNWILETTCTIIIVLIKNPYSTVIYLLIISSGTPLVYYLGIEENRRQAQARFREHIKMLKNPILANNQQQYKKSLKKTHKMRWTEQALELFVFFDSRSFLQYH